ncbi:hypothetical protein BDW62DRAFT_199304 [Aspergillus aurantiobrunneus]
MEAAIVQAVVANRQGGRQIIELLLDRLGNDIEDVVVQAACNENKEIIEFLVQILGGKLPVTGHVIRALARNRQSGPEILSLFVNRLEESFYLRDNVVKTVAMHGNAALITILIDRLENRFPLSPDTISAVVSNMENGLEILKLLFDRFGSKVPITPRISLFDKWGSRVRLWRQRKDLFLEFKELVCLVLNRLGGEFPALDNFLVKLTSFHSTLGGEMLLLLLQLRPGEISITHDFLKAAANTGHEGLLKLVLGMEVTALVGEEVLGILARRGTKDVMQFTLQWLGDRSPYFYGERCPKCSTELGMKWVVDSRIVLLAPRKPASYHRNGAR